MRIIYWIFGIFFCVVFNVAQAGVEVSTFDNQYTGKLLGFDIVVTSRLKAINTKGNYELSLNAEAFPGSITETSRFKWNAQEQYVIPQSYTNKISGFGKSSEDQLYFDWTKLTINNPKNNTSFSMVNTQKIQDSLSYQLQLRQDLIAGKKSFVYSVGDSNKIKEITFSIVGEEVLSTPLGKVKTVKVKRSHPQNNRYTYAWFAKNYQYLLVRLEQENKGIRYTMDISKASLGGKLIEHF